MLLIIWHNNIRGQINFIKERNMLVKDVVKIAAIAATAIASSETVRLVLRKRKAKKAKKK